jgi:hypothetical protein
MGKEMRVQKFHVYLMRKGAKHYEDVGDRVVSVSDDRHDAWLDLDGAELHAVLRPDHSSGSYSRGTGEIYLHEQ